jgi:hypothetical protein
MKYILVLLGLTMSLLAATSLALPIIASRSNTLVKKCLEHFGPGSMQYCRRMLTLPATSADDYAVHEMENERDYPKKRHVYDTEILKKFGSISQYPGDLVADEHFSGHSNREFDAGTTRLARPIGSNRAEQSERLLSRRQPNIPQGYFSQEKFPGWEDHLDSEIKAYFGGF